MAHQVTLSLNTQYTRVLQ